ncbi:hypothetical protein BU17DRAFT_81399 [Hysterangium stoloniferum]|nr:hypothetical protein BU17DRAFT_81399 [Hysterangium stoloniferum]
MNSEPHSLTSLRQWHRPPSRSSSRTPSRSSQSSAEYSRPVTPLDPASIRYQRSNASGTLRHFDTGGYWESVNPTELGVRPPPPPRNSSEEIRAKPSYKQTRSERSRSETITPATIRRILQQDFERMRIPLPKHFRRLSLSDTPDEYEDALPSCGEEFGGHPVRHPLKNLINDDTSSVSSDTNNTFISSNLFPIHGSYSEPISHSASSPPSLTSSLRLRSKRTHSHRGAITLLKSLKSSPTPNFSQRLSNVTFDWSAQRLQELSIKARLLEEQMNDVNRASPVPDSDPGTMRPRSLDMTAEEVVLAREKAEAERRRFIFKELTWSHRSLVTAHPKDIVPYPFAYDKVNIQTDRHSHNLVKQLFSGQPSVHAGLSKNPPTLVLDLGCGDGSWIIDTAQCWKNTQFYGLDLQCIHPPQSQLLAEIGEVSNNIHFSYYNFLLDKLPYLDDKFDMVRMANLKWAIPEDMWDFLIAEVYRVSKKGGYIEIIDDDFIIGSSPCASLCDNQLGVTSALEAQFMDMLQARNLLLNPGTEFIRGKLDKFRFQALHEDVFLVTIPPAGYIPSEAPLPLDAPPRKIMKVMGFSFDFDKHSSTRSRPNSVSSDRPAMGNRSRSGSTSSSASHCSSLGRMHANASVQAPTHQANSTQEHGSEKRLSSESSRPNGQPLGLETNSNWFMPFSPAEIIAHATRNMQSVLACKEAMRQHYWRKSVELEELLVKDTLHPTERQRFRELAALWEEAERAFDSAFWEYELTMLERLHLPQCSIENFVEEEECFPQPPSPSQKSPRLHVSRAVSSISQVRVGSAKTNVEEKHGPEETGTPVRTIRVYGGWK